MTKTLRDEIAIEAMKIILRDHFSKSFDDQEKQIEIWEDDEVTDMGSYYHISMHSYLLADQMIKSKNAFDHNDFEKQQERKDLGERPSFTSSIETVL